MPLRGVLVVSVVAATFVSSAPADDALAQPDDKAAEEAAEEIAAAQQRANDATQAWAVAEEELDSLEADTEALTMQQQQLEGEVAALRRAVEAAAVERYMSSGSTGIPVLTAYRTPLEQMQAAQLFQVVSGTSDDAFDRYDAALDELSASTAALEAKTRDLAEERKAFEALHRQALAEVERLRQVEAQRLADEKIRLALEAQKREEQRRMAEQQAAEAARRAADEAQRAAAQAAEDKQAAASVAAAAREQDLQAEARATAAESARSRATAAAPASPADSQPPPQAGEASTTTPPPTTSMVCPVAGPSGYSDTWGAPRSGGRSHEGVDMIAPKGTPLVAVVAGSATFKQNRLGGNAVWLAGSDGTRYYYAHLSAYEGSSRQVNAGEVIGYVGSTGNTSVDHLHFEVHPGGGGAVNPTPYVRRAGC